MCCTVFICWCAMTFMIIYVNSSFETGLCLNLKLCVYNLINEMLFFVYWCMYGCVSVTSLPSLVSIVCGICVHTNIRARFSVFLPNFILYWKMETFAHNYIRYIIFSTLVCSGSYMHIIRWILLYNNCNFVQTYYIYSHNFCLILFT